ncbi:unnamed protein product [Brassica oleracea var. botrytis]
MRNHLRLLLLLFLWINYRWSQKKLKRSCCWNRG